MEYLRDNFIPEGDTEGVDNIHRRLWLEAFSDYKLYRIVLDEFLPIEDLDAVPFGPADRVTFEGVTFIMPYGYLRWTDLYSIANALAVHQEVPEYTKADMWDTPIQRTQATFDYTEGDPHIRMRVFV
jgi:hypothetical protein